MTFLNPWMMLGGLAVSIPIALHFFYRARYRPLPWGAMKFLRLSIEQTSRRLRFQEVLLLLLRILVCIILALALARPASDALSSGSGRGESVDAFIVIDTSYSMSAKEGEKTRLDRAKEAAVKIIDNLPPNSTVKIITCSDRASMIGPKTATNLDQARHLVRHLKASSQSTDLYAGLAEAVSQFEHATGANKEVYLLGDMQRSGWERQSSAIRSKSEEIKNQATFYLVRVAEKTIKNVAIVGIAPQTEIPHVGKRIAFTVLLRNTGAEAVSNLQLTLEVDGKGLEKDSRNVEKIAPGETKAVTITGKIDQPGWRLLTARIKDDDLDEDNEYSRMLLVRERIRVLLVDGRPDSQNPSASASFFISNALLPITEEQRGTYHVQLSIVRPEQAFAGTLGDRDVCILVDVAAKQLPDDFTKALDGFVRSGKSLFFTAGPNVVPKDYNATFGELLPVPLAETEPYRAPRETLLHPDLNTAEVQSFLAKFKEGGNNPLQRMAEADTTVVLTVKDPRAEENKQGLGRVLMRFNDGKPFLVSKGIGNGETLLLTTSVDLSWSFLCVNPASPPFINGCLAHLIQRTSGSFNHVAGESLKWTPADLNRDYYVIAPDGERAPLVKQKDLKGQVSFRPFDTSKAGVYQVVAANENQGERFAFIPDLRESENLEAISDEQIDEQLDFKPVHLTTGFDGKSFTGTERSRKEWTIWVLIALLIFALGETVWAWVCGRAW